MTKLEVIRRGQWPFSPAAFDVTLSAVLTVGILAEALAEGGMLRPEVALLSVPLGWRRKYPLAAFVVVFVAAIPFALEAQYLSFFCIMVAAFSVGEFSRHRLLAVLMFLASAVFVDVKFGGALPPIPNAAGPFFILFPFWLIGMAMRRRQLRADLFEDKAARLEREQEQAKKLAMAEERSRIAREMHDVIAHSVSVMLVQAGAARQVLSSSPEEARQALLAVEESGRGAMMELRKMLGLMREEGEEQLDLAPQPGIGELDALIQRVREAGLPTELRVEGTPRPLPMGLDLTAYRIVQEALTNAMKYSDLAQTEVVLSYRDDELKLEILDEGPVATSSNGKSSGRGLVGMRERVALYGGRLEAGPRLNRGYAVRAWLPQLGTREAASAKEE